MHSHIYAYNLYYMHTYIRYIHAFIAWPYYTHAYIHTCMHTSIHVYIRTYRHTYDAYMHAYNPVCVCSWWYVTIWVSPKIHFIYSYIHTYIHTYIAYIHTYTIHTYIHLSRYFCKSELWTYMQFTYMHTYIIHICIHTYIHAYTYMWADSSVNPSSPAYIHTYIHTHTCEQIPLRILAPPRKRRLQHRYASCPYVHTCISTYIHTQP